ncbi:MAG: class I SAM-dependent methyltransferase [Fibrobacterota bacterium]
MKYGGEYYRWQKDLGTFGATSDYFKFASWIKKDYRIIDFGCGGGFLLSEIDCGEKIGIEINPEAVREAEGRGLRVFNDVGDAPDGWADLIISNHALEHTECPLKILKTLRNKLKPGGKAVFAVPNEKRNRYKTDDINGHLYTWSEMNIGNLFKSAGFSVLDVRELKHQWPPYSGKIRPVLGNRFFHVLCRIYGTLNNSISQIMIAAENPV